VSEEEKKLVDTAFEDIRLMIDRVFKDISRETSASMDKAHNIGWWAGFLSAMIVMMGEAWAYWLYLKWTN